MNASTPSQPKQRPFFALFFWLFNLSLLLILFIGFLPFLALGIFNDALNGEVPFSILIPVFGLIGVPTTSTVMGIQRQRRLNAFSKLESEDSLDPVPQRQPISLAQIFFGLEAPLLMACTIRLFFLRDLTPASSFLFVSLAVGTMACVHWLLHRHHRESSFASWAQLAGLTIMLVLSLYLSAVALFYVLPLIVMILKAFSLSVYLIILIPIFFPFIMVFSGLVSMPWGMTRLFLKAWKQSLQKLSQSHGKGRATFSIIKFLHTAFS